MSKQPGSLYHLSSLRYAKASTSSYVPAVSASGVKSTSQTPLDRLFETAEDHYRPGQSSSASLLIRSNVLPLQGWHKTGGGAEGQAGEEVEGTEEARARGGFQRTKARALLAHSIASREQDGEDALLGLGAAELGSSIYVHNRRAKRPMSGASYQQARKKKREARSKAKLKTAAGLAEAADLTDPDKGSDIDEEERIENASQERQTNETRTRTEEIESQIEADVTALRAHLPSGSLLETIHYLAAHYYDARRMLQLKRVSSSRPTQPSLSPPSSPLSSSLSPSSSSANGEEDEHSDDQDLRQRNGGQGAKRANMWRVCEGSALIALGVYMEEVIKHEYAAEPLQQWHDDAEEEGQKIAKALQEQEAENRKQKRRKSKIGGKHKKGKKLIVAGWAKRRSSRSKKSGKSINQLPFEDDVS